MDDFGGFDAEDFLNLGLNGCAWDSAEIFVWADGRFDRSGLNSGEFRSDRETLEGIGNGRLD